MKCTCWASLLRDWSDVLIAWSVRWLLQCLGVMTGVCAAIWLLARITWRCP